jgi:hypothetical protein
MALTRDSKETIRARVKRDPGFRKALLREGIENFLSGDIESLFIRHLSTTLQ